jgi:nitrogen regulatory protein PII
MVWGVWKRLYYRTLALMTHVELQVLVKDYLLESVFDSLEDYAGDDFDGTVFAEHVTKKLQLSLHGRLL